MAAKPFNSGKLECFPRGLDIGGALRDLGALDVLGELKLRGLNISWFDIGRELVIKLFLKKPLSGLAVGVAPTGVEGSEIGAFRGISGGTTGVAGVFVAAPEMPIVSILGSVGVVGVLEAPEFPGMASPGEGVNIGFGTDLWVVASFALDAGTSVPFVKGVKIEARGFSEWPLISAASPTGWETADEKKLLVEGNAVTGGSVNGLGMGAVDCVNGFEKKFGIGVATEPPLTPRFCMPLGAKGLFVENPLTAGGGT